MGEMRMPISEHLTELRARVIICILTIALGMVLAYIYCPDVFYPIIRAPLDAIEGKKADNPFVLNTPLLRLLAKHHRSAVKASEGAASPAESQLHTRSLIDPLMLRLKISLIVGVLLALPVIVYEVWAFVSAGLYAHERKYALVYGPASFFLFVAGAALAYFVVLPVAVVFLLEQGYTLDLKAVLMAREYLPFVLWLLLGFGLIFQMPLVVLFLTKLGIVEPASLIRRRRHAILVMCILAAFFTPPDPFTMIAMCLPMLVLYECSILLSRSVAGKRQGRPRR